MTLGVRNLRVFLVAVLVLGFGAAVASAAIVSTFQSSKVSALGPIIVPPPPTPGGSITRAALGPIIVPPPPTPGGSSRLNLAA